MNNKYKIALFYDTYGRPHTGGTTVRPHNLVKMLLKHNIDFKVFSISPPYPEYDIPGKILNISKFRPKDFNVYWVENSFKAVSHLNAKGILPILGTNIIPNSASQHCLPYLNKAGKSTQEASINREKLVIENFKAKFWLSQSDFQEKEYRRLGLPYNMSVYRAPNPIDINLFYPVKEKPKEFIIAWTGKNNWAKHPIFLQQIASTFPLITFYCISDHEIPIKFTSNVKMMIGKTNKEVSDLLRQSSLFLSTSVTENQPLGVLESMATGLPVVAFRTSGMPEIVKENYNGRLVDLGNIDHFKIEIERLLRNPEERDKLGKNGRKYIEENFSYDVCYKIYRDIFQKYLEPKQ